MRTRRNATQASADQLWLFPSLAAPTLDDRAETADAPQERHASQIGIAERIVTIPASEPFLPTLARALIDGTLIRRSRSEPHRTATGPLDLSSMTLLLPTRRATRGLQAAFLDVSPARAVLLPAIRPISEGDEDASLLAGLTGLGDRSALALDLPPAVCELERQLVLTKLVLRWSDALGGDAARGAKTPAQAIALARELTRLVDMAETEGVTLDRLEGIVREDFSAHWQQTLDFLQIVTAWWPAYLESVGRMSAAERRNRLIIGEAERLAAMPPAGPVIVAGVTGSIPATVALMRTVARLPNGAIVLPGLDLGLDDESWQAVTGSGIETVAKHGAIPRPAGAMPPHPEHPQFGLKTLLDRLGLSRTDIAVLSRADRTSANAAARAERARLVSEALRPSATTARWLDTIATTDRATAAQAIDGITLIEAPSAQDEAEAVAIILREAAETPGRTAALVSPDRLLARRVAIRLEAWGIRVDDSAGRPLRKTPPGALLDLIITAIAEDFAPKPLMAVLKHPLTRLGLDPFTVRRSARALEIAVFRGPYLGSGLDGIAKALEAADRDCAVGPEQRGSQRRTRAAMRLFAEDWQAARDLVVRFAEAYAPLIELWQASDIQPLAAFAAAHAAVAEALAAQPPPDPQHEASRGAEDASPLWQGEAGTTARAILEGLTRPGLPAPDLRPADYPDVYRALVATETVRPRVPVHTRLSIWGPFEARLQQPDIVILGGLNDGTWPEAADPGPWLNRPMRNELGLPAPEEKIGYAAHDFSMLMGAPRVFLTRAEKIDGVPTVPSRWLMRLEALLGGLGLAEQLRSGSPSATYLAWARQRDTAGQWSPVKRPEPRPAVDLRPRRLSVSKVETWIGNPYAIFASDILRLEALPHLGAAPDASIRGAIVHEAMARFAKAHPAALPTDIEAALMAEATLVLREWSGHTKAAAFWAPRFARFAAWFAETEARRRGASTVVAEVPGTLEIVPPSGRPFVITARADRLDIGASGGVTITDYKTGTPPSKKAVKEQRKPQLPLEGAILEAGGFRNGTEGGLLVGRVAGLRYIKASGGEPAGDEKNIDVDDLVGLIKATADGLARHVAHFDDPATPYAAVRRGGFTYDYDAYAQLARVAEWSATGMAANSDDGSDDANGENGTTGGETT